MSWKGKINIVVYLSKIIRFIQYFLLIETGLFYKYVAILYGFFPKTSNDAKKCQSSNDRLHFIFFSWEGGVSSMVVLLSNRFNVKSSEKMPLSFLPLLFFINAIKKTCMNIREDKNYPVLSKDCKDYLCFT